MVRTLISGSSCLGFSLGWGHCIMFLLSQCFSPPRGINGYREPLMLGPGGNPAMD